MWFSWSEGWAQGDGARELEAIRKEHCMPIISSFFHQS
jgi:hypothetical protein